MNHDDEPIAMLETRVAALERQFAYLTERDNAARTADLALVDGGVI